MLSEDSFAAAITSQLDASLAMLDNAMADCPDTLWDDGSAEGFRPPAPFGLEELDPAGVLPPRAYTRAELRGYAGHCRARVADAAAGLDPGSPPPVAAGSPGARCPIVSCCSTRCATSSTTRGS